MPGRHTRQPAIATEITAELTSTFDSNFRRHNQHKFAANFERRFALDFFLLKIFTQIHELQLALLLRWGSLCLNITKNIQVICVDYAV